MSSVTPAVSAADTAGIRFGLLLSVALPVVAVPAAAAMVAVAVWVASGNDVTSSAKANLAPRTSGLEGQVVRTLVPSPPAAIGPAPQIARSECHEFVDAAGALPSPCRPGASAPGEPLVAMASRHARALGSALDAFDKRDFAGAQSAALKIDPVADHLVSWMAALSPAAGLKASQIARTIAALPDWPGQAQLRARYEEALGREHPDDPTVLKIFADAPPSTATGLILYAKALAASGETDKANALVRRYWREALVAGDGEPAVLSAFGGVLTADDHQARAARLLYAGRTADADRAAKLLDKDRRDMFAAWVAATRQRRDADKLLDKVAPELRQDPGYLFARIESLCQGGRVADAAAMMQASPTDPKVLIDPDAWSEERQLLARNIAAKDPQSALALTAADVGASASERTDSEFEAGWYALRYLDDANTAASHFRTSAALATTPLKQARAEYWSGRAADALGEVSVAAEHYRAAGRFPTTFYGQLALVGLGSAELPIAPPPIVDEKTEQRFLSRELVQVAGRLAALGRNDQAGIFYRYLAETLTDPAEIALLARMAEGQENYALALQVGKVAIGRQSGVDAIAFPIAAVPALDRADVELPAVYAVARQESAFQVAAVSPAGARGLLQLMPSTAREVAGRLGMPFSADRLSADATYNTTLGAAFLGSLVAHFNGSYAMSFAAYNAGEGRVQEWAKTYGDPRGHDVDVVDWIERIPFDETRNYVQRTLENLQVYRARMGLPALRLAEDLTGHPGGWSDPLAGSAAKHPPAAEPPKPQPVPAGDTAATRVASIGAGIDPKITDHGAGALEKPAKAAPAGPDPRHAVTDHSKSGETPADNVKAGRAVADSAKGKRAPAEKAKPTPALAENGKSRHVVADNSKSHDVRRVTDKTVNGHLTADRSTLCSRGSSAHAGDAAHRPARRCVA